MLSSLISSIAGFLLFSPEAAFPSVIAAIEPAAQAFSNACLRCLLAAGTSFALLMICAPSALRWLSGRCRERIVSDSERLNELHAAKQNTPTMGGLLIVFAVLSSTLIWCDLCIASIQISIFVLLTMTALGAVDDWFKLTHRSSGMTARRKLLFQAAIGVLTGLAIQRTLNQFPSDQPAPLAPVSCLQMFNTSEHPWWVIAWTAFLIIAVSNAVNLADGLDGLASGCSLTTLLALIVISFITVAGDSMRNQLAVLDPLQQPVPQRQREMVEAAVQLSALGGSLLAFLWFNSFPARVFMGDTGSLPIGGLLAFNAIMIRCELLLVVAGGVFVVETLSVILQVAWFKRTRRRLLLCSPLHNHFVFRGDHEQKIVVRFWIVSIVLSILAVTAYALVT
jgi:phospho-N-acetylmuramoyl-pentapeptide-transferase